MNGISDLFEAGEAYIERASKEAKQGSAPAKFFLSQAYYHGFIVEKSTQEALKWLFEAAVQNNVEAQIKIGTFYQNGDGGLPQSKSLALEFYKRAAKQQQPDAQCRLGELYSNDIGTVYKAVKWYQQASELNYPAALDALKRLGQAYNFDFSANLDLRKNALQGDQQAQIEHAIICLNQNCTLFAPQVFKRLLRLSQSIPEALFQLGRCYLVGFGTPRSPSMADMCLQKAQKASPHLRYMVGITYLEHGQSSLAIECLRWAAIEGSAQAKEKLGYLVDKGHKEAESAFNTLPHQSLTTASAVAAASEPYVKLDMKSSVFLVNLPSATERQTPTTAAAAASSQLEKKNNTSPSKQDNSVVEKAQKFVEQGKLHREGKKHREAFEFFIQAEKLGSQEVYYYLAEYHCKGGFVNSDPKLGWDFYQKAIKQNDHVAESHYALGKLYQDAEIKMDEPMSKRLERAFYHFYKAGKELDYASAWLSLGYCYREGKGVSASHDTAVIYFEKAAKNGDAFAKCVLGSCFEKAEGVPASILQAIRCYHQATDADRTLEGIVSRERIASLISDLSAADVEKLAEEGYCLAQQDLGGRYYNGVRGKSRSIDQAKLWLEKSSNSGSLIARCGLADCYDAQKNYEEAFAIYLELSKKEISEVFYKLGVYFEKGYGREKNASEALSNYIKGKEKGHTLATGAYARCLLTGDCGCPINKLRGFEMLYNLYQKGQLEIDLICLMATCYVRGDPIPQNLEVAKKLFHVGSELKHPESKYQLALLLRTDPRENEVVKRLLSEAARSHEEARVLLVGIMDEVARTQLFSPSDSILLRKSGGLEDIERFLTSSPRNNGSQSVSSLQDYRTCSEKELFDLANSRDKEVASKARCELGRRYAKMGNEATALAYFKHPTCINYPESQYRRGLLLCKKKEPNKQNLAEAKELFEMAATKNHLLATYQLGKCYEYGRGVVADLSRAYGIYSSLLTHIAALPRVAFLYARMNYRGAGCSKDIGKAFTWFEKAVKHGYKKAHYNLGIIYEEGLLGKKDLVEAKRCYEIGARLGISDAGCRLRRLNGNHSDYFAELKYKADEGDSLSAYEVGNHYQERRDFTNARYYWEKAARKNHPQALFMLGRYYHGKIDPQINNLPLAFDYFLKATAAAPRFADAEYEVAFFYYYGWGMKEPDEQAGARFLISASASGHGEACYQSGRNYEKGTKGYPKSTKLAMECYKNAAIAEIPSALLRLGQIYQQGELDQPKNEHEAIKNYEMAKKKGLAEASAALEKIYSQYSPETLLSKANAGEGWAAKKLGDLYYNGSPATPKNLREALQYYQRANSLGITGVNKRILDIEWTLGVSK